MSGPFLQDLASLSAHYFFTYTRLSTMQLYNDNNKECWNTKRQILIVASNDFATLSIKGVKKPPKMLYMNSPACRPISACQHIQKIWPCVDKTPFH